MPTLNVPIAKAGKSIEIDTETINGLDQSVLTAIVLEGLTAILNKRMTSKSVGAVTKLEGAEKEKAQAAAMKIANENLDKLLKNGDTGKKKTAAVKIAGVVMTEAKRLAREVVKNEIRAAGKKISHYSAAEITRAAVALIEQDQSFIDQAKANIEARAAKSTAGDDEAAKKAAIERLEKLGGIKESPKLVAKAAEEAAERKKQLSAKQAGKTAHKVPPAKGSQPHVTH